MNRGMKELREGITFTWEMPSAKARECLSWSPTSKGVCVEQGEREGVRQVADGQMWAQRAPPLASE